MVARYTFKHLLIEFIQLSTGTEVTRLYNRELNEVMFTTIRSNYIGTFDKLLKELDITDDYVQGIP
jgi:hypothetical protein